MFSPDFNRNAKACYTYTVDLCLCFSFSHPYFIIITETSQAMQYGIIKYYYISSMKDYQRQGRSRTNALKTISSVTVTAHVNNNCCLLSILCKFYIKTKYCLTNTRWDEFSVGISTWIFGFCKSDFFFPLFFICLPQISFVCRCYHSPMKAKGWSCFFLCMFFFL